MVIEPLKLKRPVVSKRGSKKTKAIVLIGGIVVSFVIVFSIVTVLGTGMTTTIYPLKKGAICTSKVLELAQKGIIREAGGYNGAIYECTHMHGFNSVYGKASE